MQLIRTTDNGHFAFFIHVTSGAAGPASSRSDILIAAERPAESQPEFWAQLRSDRSTLHLTRSGLHHATTPSEAEFRFFIPPRHLPPICYNSVHLLDPRSGGLEVQAGLSSESSNRSLLLGRKRVAPLCQSPTRPDSGSSVRSRGLLISSRHSLVLDESPAFTIVGWHSYNDRHRVPIDQLPAHPVSLTWLPVSTSPSRSSPPSRC
ncbi:hypothetical protein B0J18DRAFT_31462 [Chaetomium sp. MPI-SDFR-AT-0129]|nr:hypothetical protein B0J18DRAFT_31462 [Chaetomium sp. MPI-SDFR-AT-0129]